MFITYVNVYQIYLEISAKFFSNL